jgi:hypothetical protein
MGNVPGMQVEKIGRVVVGFEHGQVLRAEMLVRLFAGKDRKEERQVASVQSSAAFARRPPRCNRLARKTSSVLRAPA